MMKSLKTDILNNWEIDIRGFAQPVRTLCDNGFPCWTIKFFDSYGVAVPYRAEEGVNEIFSNARIKSDLLNTHEGQKEKVILLIADYSVAKESFSLLCEAFISPGESGKNRQKVSETPLLWCREWKELLGNRNVDETVYDILGELCVFKYCISQGKDANWGGPFGATYDIEMENDCYEVKSTTSRYKKEVTISSQFQLDPQGKTLNLVLCQFEESPINGLSIDSVIQDLVVMGVDYNYLESRLEKKGIEEDMSVRRRRFILHEMLKYCVDEHFPRIIPSSFAGGVIPSGIKKITYTVDLNGLESVSIIQGTDHEI